MNLLELFGIKQRNNELLEEAKANGAAVIDVRTPAEFKQGHYKGSINIPLNELEGKMAQIKKMKQPLLICCASGMRSGSATSMLKRASVDCVNAGSWTSL